ncbi:MAG: RHS repeat-associated core domain-containing protein [Bryobacteraceae bacterium]|jgi:RHS repeat-associated protein
MGLDYFGARYFSGAQGRFTSPDPLLASARLEDPQTWNRYAYARNNPLRFTDPEGLYPSPQYNCSEDSKSCLNDEQRRILENSGVKVGDQTLSGKALWEAIGKQENGEKLQNAFVNLTDRMASVTFGNGENALSQVSGISAFAPDRIFANVSSSLLSDIKASGQFTTVSAGMHGDYNAISFKDWDVPLGNIQFSFARSGTAADIDIDIGNITNGLFGAIVHAGEVVENKVFGTTTSQDTVRKLLIHNPKVQTVTPSPDPKWNRK